MAETEILRAGSWQERRLQAEGAVVLEVLTDVPGATLAVDGLQGSLRHHSPTSGAFPLKAVVEGVMIVAAAPEGTAFPGGALVDLSLTFPSTGHSYLLQRIDVSGHGRAPLIELTWDQDRWAILPAAEPTRSVREAAPAQCPPASAQRSGQDTRAAANPRPAAGGSDGARAGASVVPQPSADGSRAEILGSWLARRLAERGQLGTPTVSAVLVDDSASMRSHRERAAELTDLIRAFISASGAPAPETRPLAIGGAGHAGVGSAAISAAVSGAQTTTQALSGDAADEEVTVVLTDLPGRAESLPTIVVGDPDIARALLDTGASLVLPAEAWREIEREDTDYDDATLRHLAPLTRWLEDPRRPKENAR